MILTHLNYGHIAAAALVYFIIGSLWYSMLFGKQWMKLLGITRDSMTEEDKKRMPMLFGTTFILNFVTTIGTACVIYYVQPMSIMVAIKVGLLLSGAFVFTSTCMNNMYTKRPFMLTVIDSGYHVVAITIASIILTMWH